MAPKAKLSVWTGVVLALALTTLAPPTEAQTVVGSPHDMKAALGTTQRVCVFCHTPHQPAAVTTNPLWNHTLSTNANYGVYTSTTFNAGGTIVDIGGGSTVSNLCMSCHDNTVGVGSLYNDPNLAAGGEETPTNAAALINTISASANMGTDLTNDHPVNFTYDATLETNDGGLADPTTNPVLGMLFGGTVQCASCHDPHDNTFGAFLVTSNVNSALCTACHLK